jgi:four helix bundle protein
VKEGESDMGENNGIRGFKQLEVWQLGMELAIDVYRLTSTLPKHEMHGLSSQMQRAAVSIPSNIAEGHSRRSTKEYLRHISIASGSIAELETQLVLAAKLNYSDRHQIDSILTQTDRIGRMLSGLRRALRSKFE